MLSAEVVRGFLETAQVIDSSVAIPKRCALVKEKTRSVATATQKAADVLHDAGVAWTAGSGGTD